MNLASRLGEFGLYPRGGTRLTPDELHVCGLTAEQDRLMLVGNKGSSYWPVFSASPEAADGGGDPLDRWSRRVAENIATEFGLTPLFPFDGPPYLPFQRWATRAEGLAASPLGILIHPEFGLWHSYRFALAGVVAVASVEHRQSPCLGCVDQPCLSRCPVEAFTIDGYALENCADYLGANPRAECHRLGCLARRACPVAPGMRYQPAQAGFHLRAFLRARG